MRGASLFTNLFDQVEALPAMPLRKGRNADHDKRRNECLIARYYYLGKFTDDRYSKIMRQLSDEFYLAERRIQDILQQQSEVLYRLRSMQPPPSWFVQQYPHLVWPQPASSPLRANRRAA